MRQSLRGGKFLRRYLGQQNPTDNFTRLLASLVYTGIAPESFYKDPNGPDRHYDGMWVLSCLLLLMTLPHLLKVPQSIHGLCADAGAMHGWVCNLFRLCVWLHEETVSRPD